MINPFNKGDLRMEKEVILMKEFNETKKINLCEHAKIQYRQWKKDPDANFPNDYLVKEYDKNINPNAYLMEIDKFVAYKCCQRGNERKDGYKNKVIRNMIENFHWKTFNNIELCYYNNEHILVDGWGRYLACKALGIKEVPVNVIYCNNCDEVIQRYHDLHDDSIRTKIVNVDDFWTAHECGSPLTKFIIECFEKNGINVDKHIAMNIKKNDSKGHVVNNEISKLLFQKHCKDINKLYFQKNKTFYEKFEKAQKEIECSINIACKLRRFTNNVFDDQTYTAITKLQSIYNSLMNGLMISKNCKFEELFSEANKCKVNEERVLKFKSGKTANNVLQLIKLISKTKMYGKTAWGEVFSDNKKNIELLKTRIQNEC